MRGGGGVEEAEEDSSAPPGPRLNPAALGPPLAAPGALPSQPVSLFSRPWGVWQPVRTWGGPGRL